MKLCALKIYWKGACFKSTLNQEYQLIKNQVFLHQPFAEIYFHFHNHSENNDVNNESF